METVETQEVRGEHKKISQQAAKGGTWTVGARVISRIIDLGTLVALAHILHPKDFGLVAIAMTVIYLGSTPHSGSESRVISHYRDAFLQFDPYATNAEGIR